MLALVLALQPRQALIVIALCCTRCHRRGVPLSQTTPLSVGSCINSLELSCKAVPSRTEEPERAVTIVLTVFRVFLVSPAHHTSLSSSACPVLVTGNTTWFQFKDFRVLFLSLQSILFQAIIFSFSLCKNEGCACTIQVASLKGQ